MKRGKGRGFFQVFSPKNAVFSAVYLENWGASSVFQRNHIMHAQGRYKWTRPFALRHSFERKRSTYEMGSFCFVPDFP